MSACVVEVNGTEYYAPCDKIEYINEIDGYLINTGSSSITLYYDFPSQSVNGSGYPRISMPSNTKATYRSSQTATQTELQVSSYKVISKQSSETSFYSLLILGVLICQFLKH